MFNKCSSVQLCKYVCNTVNTNCILCTNSGEFNLVRPERGKHTFPNGPEKCKLLEITALYTFILFSPVLLHGGHSNNTRELSQTTEVFNHQRTVSKTCYVTYCQNVVDLYAGIRRALREPIEHPRTYSFTRA